MELLGIIKDFIVAVYEWLKFIQYNFHWEESITMRDGKFHRAQGPGMHLKWPVYEYCTSANVKQDTMEPEPVAITTKNGIPIEVGIIIVYYVNDIKKFLVENNDSLSNAVDMARAEISDLLEDKEWDQIKRKTTDNTLRSNIQERFDTLGMKINYIKFTTKIQVRGFRVFTDRANKVHPTLNA